MKDIIKVLNQIIFLYAAVYFVTGIYGSEEAMPAYAVWVVVLTLGCYLIRIKGKRLSLFLAGHVFVAAVGVGLVQLLQLGGGFLAVLICAEVISVLLRLLPVTDLLEEPGYLHLGALAVEYFTHLYLERSQGAIRCALMAFLVTLLLKVIYGNLKEADEFIRKRAASTKIDEAKLKRLNYRITFLYSGVLGVILLVTGMTRDNRLYSMLFGGLGRLLRRVLDGLGHLPEELQEQNMVDANAGMQGMVPTEPIEASPWGEVFDVLIGVFTVVFGVAIVVLVVVGIVRAVNHYFYNKQEGRQETVDYVEPLTVKKRIQKEKRRTVFEVFERDPAKRVRRYYRKALQKSNLSERLHCLSPSEQVESAADKKNLTKEAQKEIIGLYEKARYTETLVSEAEAKRMLELLK